MIPQPSIVDLHKSAKRRQDIIEIICTIIVTSVFLALIAWFLPR
jgi:hypothetical protein